MAQISGIYYFDRPHANPEPVCQLDGRIDNPRCGRSVTEVVLESRLEDLIGDWSLALPDAAERTVQLASDYAGSRPLYYSWTPQRLVWSSSLPALASSQGPCEINPDYIAEFLTRGASAENTPYRGIHAVPAGYVLSFSAEGVRRKRLWNPPYNKRTLFSAEVDYEEQLRILFREAVRTRLSAPGHAVAELSGGLDSTSVVCMALDLIRKGEAAATTLTTVSFHDDPGSDDAFIARVEAECGVSGRSVDLRRFGFASPEAPGQGSPSWWSARHTEVARWMEEVGARSVLTGQLGDLVMGNWFDGTEQVAHHLAHLRPGAAARTAFDWGRTQRQAIYPILRRAAQSALGWKTEALYPPDSVETSLSAQTAARASELHYARLAQDDARQANPERRDRLEQLLDILRIRHLQTPESLQPVTYSHPFSHRPLVEFMMTIPAHIVYRAGEPRRLMRRAFAGLLPQSVLNRRSKMGYNDAFRRSLVPMANQLLHAPSLLLADAGFVDADSLRRRLRNFAHGLPCNDTLLRQILICEFWLRARSGIFRQSGSTRAAA